MLHFVHSNNMDVLSARLISILHSYLQENSGRSATTVDSDNKGRADNVFTPQQVLVQSPGMAQWLKLNIASATGLMANIQFPLPSTYIWSLYQKHFDDLPDESAFTKDNLTWKILSVLPEMLEQEEFRLLRQYLQNDEYLQNDDNPMKLYQLAVKIADIYDQYLMYRPDWITHWEHGNDRLADVDVGNQPWQPILWRRVIKYTEELAESPYHRANMHTELLSRLQSREVQHTPLFIFGMSTIPTPQLEVFNALAERQPVYLFWLNPSEHFWADIVDSRHMAKKQLSLMLEPDDVKAATVSLSDTGHPLLASWGKVGRDFLSQLLDFQVEQEDLFIEPANQSLLEKVQYDIFALSDIHGRAEKSSIARDDRSIQVTVAHSPVRELEILRDRILHWLQTGVVDSVDEVVVMMPDVARYGPYIDAVFSSADFNNKAIPYAISDRNLRQEYSLSEALLSLLMLHHKRLSLSDLFTIFEMETVLTQFGVLPDEAQAVKNWCQSANIRWGLDASDKARWDVPELENNTWLFGIRRILAGYACSQEVTTGHHDILPLIATEGQNTEALGKFLTFIEAIQSLLSECQQKSNLNDKVQLAEETLSYFFAESEENAQVFSALRGALASLSEHYNQYSEAISQEVFVAALQQKLDMSGVGQRFLTGRVNFTTLMPMRSIPFKVVCLLGMNDGDYPRQVVPVGFDLMQYSSARRGDRARRMDDRYLFLEALISARKCFYLSYVGRSDQDNSVKNPSILISELLEYCEGSYNISSPAGETESCDLTSLMVTRFPLQPFHPDNFTLQPSYHENWHIVAQAMQERLQRNSLPPSPFLAMDSQQIIREIDDSEVQCQDQLFDVQQILRCLRNPVAYYFKHTWHTYFPTAEEMADEDEPLALDALGKYWLMADVMTSSDPDAVTRQWQLTGNIPDGQLGQYTAEQITSICNSIKGNFQRTTGLTLQTLSSLSDVIKIGQQEIRGKIEYINEPQHRAVVLVRPGKLRLIDELHLFIQLCFAVLSEKADVDCGYFVSTDKVIKKPAPDKAEATAYLVFLLRFMELAKTTPMPFFPRAAGIWYEKQDKELTLKGYSENGMSIGEGMDKHAHRIFPVLEPVFDAFAHLVDLIVAPVRVEEDDK